LFVFCSDPYCASCTNADVNADVYYTGSDDGLGAQLYDEFVEHCDAIKAIEGVKETFDPCGTITVTAIGGDSDGGDYPDGGIGGGGGGGGDDADDSDQEDKSADDDDDETEIIGVIEDKSAQEDEKKMAAGALAGIILAALAALALLMLLLRRRRRDEDDILKHESFEDEVGDQTFMLDDRSRSLNDTDSRFGMYPEGRAEGMMLGERALNQDVHKCSSATCELCERSRQGGLQFLPTRARSMAARQNLTGSTRKYGSEDTVNL